MQGSYELMLVFSPKEDRDKQEKVLEEIKKSISPGGKIEKMVSWGKKILAYPIKKEKEGNFWLLTLAMTGKEAEGLSAKLRLNEFILRYLLTRRK